MSSIPEQTSEHAQIEAPKQEVATEISSVEADEIAYEQSEEKRDDILHAESTTPAATTLQAPAVRSEQTHTAYVKDEEIIEVEKILEEGIGPFYQSLPEDAKPLFKKKGEEVAREIAKMVRTMHVHLKRLVKLISDWLKVIPGVNKYFLEQEAKIKADRVVDLIEERKNKSESV